MVPSTAPIHWASTNIATELGAIPENELLQARAKVTVGLANTNEEVMKNADVIQAGIMIGANLVIARRFKNCTIPIRPAVAITSLKKRLLPVRWWVEANRKGFLYIKLAIPVPAIAPSICAAR